MNIELVKTIGFGELEAMIRDVRLLKSPDVKVYERASVTLREMSTDEVNPTTFYLIKDHLAFQKDLREYMKSTYDIDTLHLEGALVLLNHDTKAQWTLTPPIIELTPRSVQYAQQAGELAYDSAHQVMIPIINDGAHRVFTARQAGDSFAGLQIVGALEEFPFYAHPNGWDEVKLVDETPSTKAEKKLYAREDCYGLYRDFGPLGCGAPRHLGPKSGE